MYTVKNSKSCRGRDGIAYSCTLHRDGKKVADVQNEGNGGETRWDWVNAVEEKAFEEYALTQISTIGGEPEPMNPDMLIASMLDGLETVKRIKRLSKKTMLFSLKDDLEDGSIRTMKMPYSDEVRDMVLARYGDRVKVIYDLNGEPIQLPVQKEAK